MTIELRPEHQRIVERVMHTGACPDIQHVIGAALEALDSEHGRSAAIETLKTFGKTHGLSLGGVDIGQLRHEARP